ncbi:MAG: hypothetical protein ACP5CD_03285 [Thermovirgaceae bacterium]
MASSRAFAKNLLLLFLAAGLVASLFYNFRQRSEISFLQAQISDFVLTENILEKKNESLRQAIPPGPDWDQRVTESITNPRERVLEDLLSRRDLLPWEGVLGGTMKIHRAQDVWFFGPSWCLAYVEDGHIGGYLLLSYKIRETEIEWDLLDAVPLE